MTFSDETIKNWDNVMRPELGYHVANEFLNVLIDRSHKNQNFYGYDPAHLINTPMDALNLFEVREVPARQAPLIAMMSDAIELGDCKFIMERKR